MSGVTYELIDDQQQWQIFDEAARRLLSIDGEEFERRWERGEYLDNDDSGVMQVAFLRPYDSSNID
ncbi:hypothetical protein [Candidatus Poriferisodalis sp.]|uniref:hypothetical protein n=1 Tax=Candidatus Poriferisodalis sp. TaxID=3101277 RepID=UPI003B01DA59